MLRLQVQLIVAAAENLALQRQRVRIARCPVEAKATFGVPPGIGRGGAGGIEEEAVFVKKAAMNFVTEVLACLAGDTGT